MFSVSQVAKTILITGSNKGIGFGIVRGLLEKSDNYKIIFTARSEERGKKSLDKLFKEFSNKQDKLFFHQLDITDSESIQNCMSWIKSEFGQIDILVNNAAVASKGSNFDVEVLDFTFKTNVYGTIDVTEKFLAEDLLRKNGKIVMISSYAGCLVWLSGDTVKEKFKNENLTIEELLSLGDEFKQAIIDEKVIERGWVKNAYCVSKMIINTYTRILGKRKDIVERNIGVHSCHPGWVKTDMAGDKAPLTVEEGVITPIYCIELEEGINPETQGKYFDLCKVKSYYD